MKCILVGLILFTYESVATSEQTEASQRVLVNFEQPGEKMQYHIADIDKGSYKYGYKLGIDPNGQFHHEARGPDNITYGCYGSIDPANIFRVVHYIADAKGYRIIQPYNTVEVYFNNTSDAIPCGGENCNNVITTSIIGNKALKHTAIEWDKLYFPSGCQKKAGGIPDQSEVRRHPDGTYRPIRICKDCNNNINAVPPPKINLNIEDRARINEQNPVSIKRRPLNPNVINRFDENNRIGKSHGEHNDCVGGKCVNGVDTNLLVTPVTKSLFNGVNTQPTVSSVNEKIESNNRPREPATDELFDNIKNRFVGFSKQFDTVNKLSSLSTEPSIIEENPINDELTQRNNPTVSPINESISPKRQDAFQYYFSSTERSIPSVKPNEKYFPSDNVAAIITKHPSQLHFDSKDESEISREQKPQKYFISNVKPEYQTETPRNREFIPNVESMPHTISHLQRHFNSNQATEIPSTSPIQQYSPNSVKQDFPENRPLQQQFSSTNKPEFTTKTSTENYIISSAVKESAKIPDNKYFVTNSGSDVLAEDYNLRVSTPTYEKDKEFNTQKPSSKYRDDVKYQGIQIDDTVTINRGPNGLPRRRIIVKMPSSRNQQDSENDFQPIHFRGNVKHRMPNKMQPENIHVVDSRDRSFEFRSSRVTDKPEYYSKPNQFTESTDVHSHNSDEVARFDQITETNFPKFSTTVNSDIGKHRSDIEPEINVGGPNTFSSVAPQKFNRDQSVEYQRPVKRIRGSRRRNRIQTPIQTTEASYSSEFNPSNGPPISDTHDIVPVLRKSHQQNTPRLIEWNSCQSFYTMDNTLPTNSNELRENFKPFNMTFQINNYNESVVPMNFNELPGVSLPENAAIYFVKLQGGKHDDSGTKYRPSNELPTDVDYRIVPIITLPCTPGSGTQPPTRHQQYPRPQIHSALNLKDLPANEKCNIVKQVLDLLDMKSPDCVCQRSRGNRKRNARHN